jgi:iron complex outermembrane receptor protein
VAAAAAQPADTLLAIPEVSVEVNRLPTLPADAPASVRRLDSVWLNRSASPDLAEALNAVPGVMMETRGAGGSRRIQLRSSGLRSPFAVRNIVMLHDGFIMTHADGVSPMEWWGPGMLETLDVTSGPAGAAWGSGYGGVLAGVSPDRNGTEISLRAGAPASGSFEGSRGDQQFIFATRQAQSPDKSRLSATIIAQNNDGYRRQESNERMQFDGHWRRDKLKEDGLAKSHLWLGLLRAGWDLPGSITAEAADTLPTQAPGQPFEAGVDRSSGLLGFSHVNVQPGGNQTGFWALVQHSQKQNPFGTSPFYQGDKTERESNLSLRFQQWQHLSQPSRPWQWLAEGSAMVQADDLAVLERDQLAPASETRYDVDIRALRGWAGGSLRAKHESGWLVEGQIAAEAFLRSLQGTGGATGLSPISDDFKRLAIQPRLLILRHLRPAQGAIAFQASSGTSDPTAFELIDPVGLVPLDLATERAQAFELGWRHPAFTMALYGQQIRNAIVTIPGPNDAPITSNAGTLNMLGLEFAAEFDYIDGPKNRLTHALALNLPHHRNAAYANPLPGTPLGWGMSRIVGRFGQAHSVDVLTTFRGEVPLNDFDTERSSRVVLWDGVYTYQKDWRDRSIQVSLGIRNATNAQTSNWWQLNAFGGKSHNPAPGRQIWLGMRLGFIPAQ